MRLIREQEKELAALERATRTIFAYNVHPKAQERDIFEFFSKAGGVNDIKLITDKNSGRSKGMAYVEFARAEDILAASTLAGQPLMGVPVMVKASEAEKNTLWEAEQAAKQNKAQAVQLLSSVTLPGPPGAAPPADAPGPPAIPSNLRINNLPPDVTDEQLKQFFEPFGALDGVQLVKDGVGRSMGYGYVTFRNAAEGANAMTHWNGQPLAGKVGGAGARQRRLRWRRRAAAARARLLQLGCWLDGTRLCDSDPAEAQPPPSPARPRPPLSAPAFPQVITVEVAALAPPPEAAPAAPAADLDEEGESFKLTSSSRQALMNRLAGAAGMSIPQLALPGMPLPGPPQQAAVQPGLMLEQGMLGPASPIPTPCLLLKNMFTDADKALPGWQDELAGDVSGECNKYGQVLHVYVDPASKVGPRAAEPAAPHPLLLRLRAGFLLHSCRFRPLCCTARSAAPQACLPLHLAPAPHLLATLPPGQALLTPRAAPSPSPRALCTSSLPRQRPRRRRSGRSAGASTRATRSWRTSSSFRSKTSTSSAEPRCPWTASCSPDAPRGPSGMRRRDGGGGGMTEPGTSLQVARSSRPPREAAAAGRRGGRRAAAARRAGSGAEDWAAQPPHCLCPEPAERRGALRLQVPAREPRWPNARAGPGSSTAGLGTSILQPGAADYRAPGALRGAATW
jgi:RNA-binding protein 39